MQGDVLVDLEVVVNIGGRASFLWKMAVLQGALGDAHSTENVIFG